MTLEEKAALVVGEGRRMPSPPPTPAAGAPGAPSAAPGAPAALPDGDDRRDTQPGSGRGRHDPRHPSPGHHALGPGGRTRRPADQPDPGERHEHLLRDGVPGRDAARVLVGHRARDPRGTGDGQGSPRVRRRRAARPGDEHPQEPALRQELRVLLRRPAGNREDGGRHGEWRPVERGWHVDQALRRQQRRDRAERARHPRQRAGAARDLPRRLPDRGAGGSALDGDVVLQPDQRHLYPREPRSPDDDPAERLGLRGLRDDRLGRRPGPGRAGRSGQRPHHAGLCGAARTDSEGSQGGQAGREGRSTGTWRGS